MTVDRRSLLKGLAAASAVSAVPVATARAREKKHPPADAVGMLYDATLCIGCKTCVVACRQANGLPYESHDGLHDDPIDLSGKTKNVIKVFHQDGQTSFMKAQCMHCVDPACASACMMGSFQKREHGVVTWKPDRCIGCRYCQIACPYEIPKFQWDAAIPKIVKCEMCSHRLAKGQEPACTEVCPRKAVIFGKYTDLLAEAHRRLEASPGRYEPKMWGETDGGGTQVLYLTAKGIPFEKLGMPAVGDDSPADLSETVQHGIYKGAIAPVALYVVLGGVMLRNRRANKGEGSHE